MKKLILCLTIICSTFFATAQTAANFNCADCSSSNHDLFTELNAGKIIVLEWVMPCSACINGAVASQAAVQSFSSTNPGQVLFYVSDDYANSNCATVLNWCTANSITPFAIFSNTLVSMSPYGTAGMPKVIVLGGNSHTVFYNQNGNTITQSAIQNAITNAITANATVLKENNVTISSMEIYPNPSSSSANLSLKIIKETKVKIEVTNLLGQKIMDVYSGSLSQGENVLKINTTELTTGNYFITCSDGTTSKTAKLIIVR